MPSEGQSAREATEDMETVGATDGGGTDDGGTADGKRLAERPTENGDGLVRGVPDIRFALSL